MNGGDQEPDFGALIFRHCDALYNFARIRGHNPADAEDLVQATYERAVRARGSFTPGTNEKAWLIKILLNLSRDKFRQTMFERTHITHVPNNDTEEPGEPLGLSLGNVGSTEERTHRHFDVRRALHSIPRDPRTLLVLKYMDGFTCAEIREIFGIPLGTVMSQLHGARKLLGKRLKGYKSGGEGSVSNG
jgi:RNA polymerase sigma-70 factor (ECF subfamily)